MKQSILKGILKEHISDTEALDIVIEKLSTAYDAEIDSMDTIPKSRFSEVIKQRNLKKELVLNLQLKIELLSKSTLKLSQLSDLLKKLASYLTKFKNDKLNQWKLKAQFFNVDLKDTNYLTVSRLKPRFVIPLSDLLYTILILLKNLSEFSLLLLAGVTSKQTLRKQPTTTLISKSVKPTNQKMSMVDIVTELRQNNKSTK